MTTPFPFQEEDVDRVVNEFNGRGLIAWEPGLGKSFASLLTASKLEDPFPMVIVCPATLKWQWQHECNIHFGWRAEILEGSQPHKKPVNLKRRIFILNYDILHARKGTVSWTDVLIGLEPKLVVLDESQYCLDPKSLRSKHVKRLCRNVPHVLALSGTPLVNRPVELFTTLSILRPHQFKNKHLFGVRYCAAKKNLWGGWEYNGASRTKELHRTLNSLMVRRRKQDVLPQLPAKQRTIILLDLPKKKKYNRAFSDFLGWLEEEAPEKAGRARKAEGLAKLAILRRLAAELKLPVALDWVDTFLAGSQEKIILFAIHKSVVKATHKRYPEISVVVDGSVTGKHRKLAIDKFLNDKATRILIGNIKAAGVGWSAKGVSNVAFLEFPWSPTSLVQAEDRVSGIGRGQEGVAASIYNLVARKTIEESLLGILERKQQVVTRILDGKEEEDFDVYQQLCQILAKVRTGGLEGYSGKRG